MRHKPLNNPQVMVQTSILDKTILSMIIGNNLEAWALLYDKYAPAMFGIICNLTNNRTLAEEIFKEAFLQLKEKQIFSKNTYPLCPYLLKHTYTFTRQKLKERGIISTINQHEETSHIHILCSQHISLKELAVKFKLTEQEAKQKVRAEFLDLRNKTKQQENLTPTPKYP